MIKMEWMTNVTCAVVTIVTLTLLIQAIKRS
uniref:Uncharacterized protein n=1 Tax=Siphoviridae sp. ctFH16 TaxID=2827817 RepID=A0A8S5TN87_9CAUD|nr:MAG TPA: hypothetical protein [Siphoviridae sp. ctFH16]